MLIPFSKHLIDGYEDAKDPVSLCGRILCLHYLDDRQNKSKSDSLQYCRPQSENDDQNRKLRIEFRNIKQRVYLLPSWNVADFVLRHVWRLTALTNRAIRATHITSLFSAAFKGGPTLTVALS